MRAAVILAVSFLVLLIGGGARFAIGLTFKPMVDEFGWARGELGLAVALYMVVSAFATFLAGRLSDRLSPRALLTAGMIVGGIGIALMSLVAQPWHALVLYGILFAIGNGAASLVIVGVIVMRAYPGRAGIANAVAISGMSVGQLLMIAILAPVLVQIGWRWVFIWIGVAHLVLLPSLFAARIAVFGWIALDQSTPSIAVFALVFGSTFLVTAPLTVVFVRESFGLKNLGALAGLITMTHQICGGIGAYAGAAIFDATGGYEAAFIAMMISALVALVLTWMLRRPLRA